MIKIEKEPIQFPTVEGLSIIGMSFFLGLSVPYGFPLTPILILSFLIFYLFYRYPDFTKIFKELKQKDKRIMLIILPYAILFSSFLIGGFSSYSTNALVKNSFHKFFLFHIYAIIFILEINEKNFKYFLERFTYYTGISSIIVSIFALVRFYLAFKGIVIQTDYPMDPWQQFLSSLTVDNNFYALGMIAGLFSVLYQKKIEKPFPRLAVIILVLNIYFAASRRAIIILGFIAIFFWIRYLLNIVRSKKLTLYKSLNLLILPVLVLSWIAIPPLLHKSLSTKTKRNISSSLGLNYSYIADFLPQSRYRYLTLASKDFDIQILREEFYTGTDHPFIAKILPYFTLDYSRWGSNDKNTKDENKRNEFSLLMFEDFKFAPSDGGRLDRYKYALTLFKERNLHEKILGNGPSYHEEFFTKFLHNSPEKILDYPHSPILSTLLYSGILGAISLIILFSVGLLGFTIPNMITIGLVSTVYLFNSLSLDIIWSNYHFPFTLFLTFKVFEIAITKKNGRLA